VSKQPIKIRPVRAGRHVRWTFEVSADVGAEKAERPKKTATKKTATKRRRARPQVKRTRPSAPRPEPPAVAEPAQPSETTPDLDATAILTPEFLAASGVRPVTPHVAQPAAAPVRQTIYLRTFAVAGVACLVIAALAFPRRPPTTGADAGAARSQPEPREPLADVIGPRPQPAAHSAAPIAKPVALAAIVASPAVSAPSKKTLVPKPENRGIAESPKSGAPVAAMAPVVDIPLKEGAAAMPRSEVVAPAAPISTGAGSTTPVTITGCLEISVKEDEFRLTDTEGVDAPRSRSWRMGFLKKRSAPVALVEPPDGLALQTHVGRRVAATGLLTSHDLKVSALRVVGPSCN